MDLKHIGVERELLQVGELFQIAQHAPGDAFLDGGEDRALLESELGANDIDSGGYDWKKLVSGRKLWNFSKHEYDAWRAAL